MTASRRRFLTASACCFGEAWLPGLRGSAARASEPLPLGAKAPQRQGPWRLEARVVSALLPGSAQAIDILSFDGTVGGPVLRIRRGETLDLALTNALDQPTSLQWHGMRCPNAADGAVGLTGPAIAPGATAHVRFTPPDSGLYWFHPAAIPGGSDQTARGLRGVLVVEEPEPPAADSDLLIAVADWQITPDAGLTKAAPMVAGGVSGGGPLTVNGKAAPEQATIVAGGRLRLRVVNASTWRLMLLAIEGARPFIVAIDGQPCELFEPVRDMVPMGPGSRFEFMLDMPRQAGVTVKLTMRGTERTGGAIEPDRVLLEVKTVGAAKPATGASMALPRNPLLPPAIRLEASTRADLIMEAAAEPLAAGAPRWRLNGRSMVGLPDRPLLTVGRGRPVTLGLVNKSGEPVALRLHGHVMRLLHPKDDGWEPYWRDSVLLPPRTTSHVAFVADNPGKWLIESAIFDQAASGLRSWFRVE